ncbi:autotransporter domain-containing protein [Nitrospirillum pindoramense]|uniref:autotransporter domain-containing protein n=1 Tax=Nitrospirillum amazonense TaxID=28077 RepID=UPI0011A2E5C7|nr:autotransporter outer membrane beta-barrel domain-containing protein [Nitrospirillum amazonense]
MDSDAYTSVSYTQVGFGYTSSSLSIPSTLGHLVNNLGGTISGTAGGVIVGGTIKSLDNAGLITGTYSSAAGVRANGNVGDITNEATGTITGAGIGLKLSGVIGTLSNSGLVNAGGTTIINYGYGYSYTYGSGIGISISSALSPTVTLGSSLAALINTAGGTIAGGYTGISMAGVSVGTLANSGVITGALGNGFGIYGAGTMYYDSIAGNFPTISAPATVGTLINNAGATISGKNIALVFSNGSLGTLINAGLITSSGTMGQGAVLTYGTIGVLTNTGTISGRTMALQLTNSTIGTLVNSGLIQSSGGKAISNTPVYGYFSITGGIGTLINAAGGTIAGLSGGLSFTDTTIGRVDNQGVIISSAAMGISLGSTYYYSSSDTLLSTTLGSLNNAAGATIQGQSGGVVLDGASVQTITNAGLITSAQGAAFSAASTNFTGGYGTTPASFISVPTIVSFSNLVGSTLSGGSGLNFQGGTMGTLRNQGLIQGTGGAGINMGYYFNAAPSASIATVINDAGASIIGANVGLALTSGVLGTLRNDGLITGSINALSLTNYNYYYTGPMAVPAGVGIILNTGTIMAKSATVGAAITTSYIDVGTISNGGLISGATAISNLAAYNGTNTVGTIGLIENRNGGTIIATNTIGAILMSGNVGGIRNDGLISATVGTFASALNVSDNATLTALNNGASGTLVAAGSAVAIFGGVGTINNAGTIQGGTAAIRPRAYDSTYADTYYHSTTHVAGGIGALSNSGVIKGDAAILSVTSIGAVSNSGTIYGSISAGVMNIGTVTHSTFSTNYYWPYYSASTTAVTTTVGGTIGVLNNTGSIIGSQSGIVNGQSTGTNTTVYRSRDYFTASILSQSTIASTTGPVGGTIGTLLNAGTILGTATAGIDNGAATAVIGTLINSGLIQGGQTGVINAGTIGTLTNSGTITGAVVAIRDSGTLGPVTNTGIIAGAIVHTAASDLSITGGSGAVFGTLTGVGGARGTLSSTASNVTLAGNLVLNDSVSIAGHTLVATGGSLVLTAPTTLTGNYAQAGGTLTAMAAGGTVGGLQVSGSASISGATVVLTSQYAYGLTSGASYTIVAAGDAASSYASVTALAPGYNSTTVTSTVVGGQTDLIVSVGNSSLSAGGAATIAGGAGTLDQMTGGSLAITGGTPTVGSISGGTIALAGGSATLGTISGGTLTQSAGSTIAGTTAVQVQGGSLNLGGTVQAPLAVNGGLVALNGTATGPVTVGSGGTLRGSGVITGAATVAGVLRPGNSPGTLTFTNGLTQAAKSVLSIDIDGTGTGAGYGNYARVLVTGGSYVIGSGATLQPNLRGMTGKATNTYTPGLGTDFTIVQAAGGVSGTFAGITQPSSGLLAGTQFTALYGSNAIDLYVTPTYGSLASLGASANQQTLGRVVAGLTGAGNADLGTVLKALYSLPTVGASLDALAQIGGSSQANIVAYSLNRGLAVTQVLGQRLAAVRDGVAGGMQGTMQAQLVGRTLYTSVASGGDGAPVGDERGAAAGSAPQEGWHFWAQGLGAFTRVDSDGNAAGGHSNTGGGLFGGDRTVAPGVTVGLAGVLLQSTSGGSNETSSYGLSAYGNVDLGDGLFVTGNAGYTYDQYDTARTMGFGGLSRTAFGHTTGDELSAGVTAGYRVRVSNLTLEPQAGIQWLKVGRDGFTETGAGALNLVLQDLDATALQSSVGGRASASWKTDGGTVITPALRAAWLHDFRDRALTSQAALAGTTFAVTGPDTGANALGIGGGLTLQEGDNLNLYANYDGTLRRHETDHVFTAGFRLSW